MSSEPASGSLYSRRFMQPQFFDGHLTHTELLYLARNRHGKFGGHLDVAGNLVMGDLTLAELPNLLFVSRFSGLEHHPGHDLFHEPLVGHADDLDVRYLRVAV